jgi:hypothetical protein
VPFSSPTSKSTPASSPLVGRRRVPPPRRNVAAPPHPPPHRCPTPLVSRATILLTRRHPLTVLILTPPTALHGSHRRALAAPATAPTPVRTSRATAAWPWAASTCRYPASGHRVSRPPRPIGFSRALRAGPALCTLFSVFQFHLHFQKFN